MTASKAVRALVSGCPQRLWGQKPLIMLQAFIDDSIQSSGERRLYLAAYVQSAETWIDFTNDWDAVLSAAPQISYFKMKEARRRRDAFQGFSEKARNKKVGDLAGVIQKHRPWGLHASISISGYKKYIEPYAPFPMRTPYYYVFYAILFGIARIHSNLGVTEPCKFIFDRQDGLPSKVIPVIDGMFETAPDSWRGLIDGTPSWEDDKKVLPLQAADMLAWCVRRESESVNPSDFDRVMEVITLADAHYVTDISDEKLRVIGEGLQEIPNLTTIDKQHWRKISELVAAGIGR